MQPRIDKEGAEVGADPIVKSAPRRHGDDIRRYYHDAFGFDGTAEESERHLTELFEEFGIPMYFYATFSRDEILRISCETELDESETVNLIKSLLHP